jgi:endo-1,4-beta-xylanase
MLWGFSDRYSWVPGISRGTYDHALIYDRDYRPKPAYEAIAAALR